VLILGVRAYLSGVSHGREQGPRERSAEPGSGSSRGPVPSASPTDGCAGSTTLATEECVQRESQREAALLPNADLGAVADPAEACRPLRR
jgi:hypothetical protein